jgi:uncharacterized protein (TIGR02145 family)
LEKPEDCKMNVRIIIMVFFPVFAISQVPQKINFQSVLRNTTGEVVSNSSVSLRISILSGTITGTSIYSETHTKTTDAGGLMSLQIGSGTVLSGVFGDINWGSSAHFIKLEADFSGGSNFVVLGTQELMSVPYALYASKTDTSALNLTSRLATKLNATDTVSLSNRINANANTNSGSSDTSLLNLTNRFSTKLNVTDTTILSNRIDTKAPINNPTFTGTVGGISKTMVGLGNVDNTSDAGKPISTATQTALDLKAPINNPTFTGTVGGISKTMVGLGNVDNTSDAGKPISSATQTALDLKAPINNPTFTGTVAGIDKTMVGLPNVDNTTDANKPISTATQTALDLKAPINNPTFMGTVAGIDKTMVGLPNVDNTTDANKPISFATQTALDLKAPINSPNFTGTVAGIDKTMVGLGNVDNTSDAGKPISSATQTALDLKAPINNPTFTGTVAGIDKTMVGLPNVDNTTDANKPISSATQTALNNKLNETDTATMLSTYLRKTDTASLSERINTKLNSSVIDLGNQTGNIIYWDNNLGKFRILAPGTAGQVLKMSSSGIPEWGTVATTSVPAFSPCGTTISDIDGNSYNTVLIGAQCWTKENLRVRRYNNGTSILFDATGGSGGSSTTWQNLTIGAHTIYANDSTATPSNLTKYGYLYNWYAAKGIYTTGNIASTDTLNICPSGWHVPTDADWTTLTIELGGESVAGGKMKSIGTSFWNSPNQGAMNESGFSALPGGFRFNDGYFDAISNIAFFWSASEHDSDEAWRRSLNAISGSVSRANDSKTFGASVRCLRD